jgi:hypothetical protein
MLFLGNTQDMTRNGVLNLGYPPTYNAVSVKLQPIYGQANAYQSYYIVRIPSIYVGLYKLPFTERELQGNSTMDINGQSYWFGGWTVDTGTTYTILPHWVYLNTTSIIWSQYTSAGGTMTDIKWEELVAIGREADTNCLVGANYCTSLDDIPCVTLDVTDLVGLPTLYFNMENDVVWKFTSENYMYPITSGCYQLGIAESNYGLIGNLQMQDYQIYLDQDEKLAVITMIPSDNNDDSNSNILNIDDIVGIVLSVLVFLGVSYKVVMLYYYKEDRSSSYNGNRQPGSSGGVVMVGGTMTRIGPSVRPTKNPFHQRNMGASMDI